MRKIFLKRKGSLVVFSGPSGVGKDTILKRLININKNIKLSISATTRPKRDYEENGRDYYFLKKSEFLTMVDNGDMLEFADYCGNYYGTPRKFVENFLNEGFDVILEIETDGALNVINNYSDAISIFVLPPSFEILKKRLLNRGSEEKDLILKRLEKAKLEISRAFNYKYLVINDDIDDCVNDVNSIIRSENLKLYKNKNIINEVLENATSVYW